MQLIALLLFLCLVIIVTIVSLILNLIWFIVAFCIWALRVVFGLVFMILLLPFILLGMVKSSFIKDSVFTQKPNWMEPRFKFKQERFMSSRNFAFDPSSKASPNPSTRQPRSFKDATFTDADDTAKDSHERGEK